MFGANPQIISAVSCVSLHLLEQADRKRVGLKKKKKVFWICSNLKWANTAVR